MHTRYGFSRGVVNDQLRGASCVAETDCELLLMHEFDWRATADQALVAALTGMPADGPAAGNGGCNPALPAATTGPASAGPTFSLISRRDAKTAVDAMKQRTTLQPVRKFSSE